MFEQICFHAGRRISRLGNRANSITQRHIPRQQWNRPAPSAQSCVNLWQPLSNSAQGTFMEEKSLRAGSPELQGREKGKDQPEGWPLQRRSRKRRPPPPCGGQAEGCRYKPKRESTPRWPPEGGRYKSREAICRRRGNCRWRSACRRCRPRRCGPSPKEFSPARRG